MVYTVKPHKPHSSIWRHKLAPLLLILLVIALVVVTKKRIYSKVKIDMKLVDAALKEPIEFTLPNDFVEYARKLQAERKLPMFMMVNEAYLSTTHSWLCNVGTLFPFLLPQIMIITTDQTTYDSLRLSKFGSWTYVGLWPLNDQFVGKLEWHDPLYKNYLTRRVRVNNLMLMSDISFLQIEPDAVWMRDPRVLVNKVIDESQADIIGSRQGGRKVSRRKKIAVGFLFLSAMDSVKKTWQHIEDELINAAMSEDYEQDLLIDLCKNHFANVTCSTFRWEEISDGNWYTDLNPADRHKFLPYVINNNFIIGIKPKIDRLKSSGHWFVTESTVNSITHFSCDDSILNRFVWTIENVRNSSRNSHWQPHWEAYDLT